MRDTEREDELHQRSMGELLSRLSRETTLLVRQEIDLAKVELTEKGKQAGAGAGMFGGATVAALGAFGALTATLILALALVMPAWLAALIVTIVYGAVAAVLAMNGKKKFAHVTPVAPQTVDTVKEDVEWAKTQIKSAGR